MIVFYNVKTRSKVEVSENNITKRAYSKTTSKGIQYRYAVQTTVDGTNLTKFVNKETYESLNVPVKE
jgi:hypothetical protein